MKKVLLTAYRYLNLFITIRPRNFVLFFGYLKDYFTYRRQQKINFFDSYPVLMDKLPSQPYDIHYFVQDIWAAKKIVGKKPKKHVDVGSKLDFVGFLTTITKVDFVDIRPLNPPISNFTCIEGSITNLPFKKDSIKSISCLHVAEHIGLGRYGDPINPQGTRDGIKELQRVLAKGGDLYFALPIGRPRVCFNAHRVHTPQQIIKSFNKLKLVEFSAIDDDGSFKKDANPRAFNKKEYSCGLFHFTK